LSPIDVTKGLVGGVVTNSKSNLKYTIGYHKEPMSHGLFI
jgi:hypothetical protein